MGRGELPDSARPVTRIEFSVMTGGQRLWRGCCVIAGSMTGPPSIVRSIPSGWSESAAWRSMIFRRRSRS